MFKNLCAPAALRLGVDAPPSVRIKLLPLYFEVACDENVYYSHENEFTCIVVARAKDKNVVYTQTTSKLGIWAT